VALTRGGVIGACVGSLTAFDSGRSSIVPTPNRKRTLCYDKINGFPLFVHTVYSGADDQERLLHLGYLAREAAADRRPTLNNESGAN
jgi:hypothetical protein